MKTLMALAVLLSAAATASALDFFSPIFMRQADEYACYHFVDPILDEDGNFEGFIFCDTTANRLVIHLPNDTLYVEHLPVIPIQTINRMDGMYRTVYVYGTDTLSGQPKLGQIVITGGAWPQTWISPVLAFADYGTPLFWYKPHLHFGKMNGREVRVVIELCRAFHRQSGDTSITTRTSSAFMADLGMESTFVSVEANRVAFGDLHPTPGCEMVFTFFRDQTISSGNDWTEQQYAGVALCDNDGDTAFIREYDSATAPGVFIGDIQPLDTYDEVIVSGSQVFDTSAPVPLLTYIGCFTVSGSEPRALWVDTCFMFEPDYLSNDGTTLVCVAGHNNRYARMDARTGDILNYEELDRWWIFHRVWYEVGTPPVRRLAALGADTLFVYEFDYSPTAVEDDLSSPLPLSFALHQNYPNPFNNETIISFTSETRRHVTLTVYNDLGQLVRKLYDSDAGPGEIIVSWDGTNPRGETVATGVYFARLQSAEGTREIKMVLVK